MDFIFIALVTVHVADAQNYDPLTSGVGFILYLLQLEIMLISNFEAFLFVAKTIDDVVGSIFALYILVLGACEAALGLSLVIAYYRLTAHLMISL